MSADYFAAPGISATAIKSGAVSMKRMHHVLTVKTEPSKAMQFGTLVHDQILGKGADYVVYQGIRRGKDWEAFKTLHEGRTILVLSEVDALKGRLGIAESVLAAHGNLLKSMEYERAIYWTEPGIGQCKAKPDAFGCGQLIDLKTCQSIEERKITANSWAMGYHLQLAWYLRGLRSQGIEINRSGLLCVESRPPYDSRVYWADPLLIEWADKECVRIAREYMACLSVGLFPGQYANAGQLIQPAFADEIVQGVPDEFGDVADL
jgi:hypothetical protein